MPGQKPSKRTWEALWAAAVLLTSVGIVVVISQSAPNDRITLVRDPVDATIVSAAGVRHPARDGEPLPIGARLVVGAGAAATARLEAAGREVYLERGTDLRRSAQSDYDLQRGTAVVDRRRGPALTLRAGYVEVNHLGRGAIRVDRNFSVRVAVLSGNADVQTAAARGTTISALHQVVVAGLALPADASPLALTDNDPVEELVVPTLVATDVYLNRVGRGLDADPTSAPRVPSAYDTGLPRTAAVSERALPLVIARAGGGGDEALRYRLAVQLRQAGGSWGPVAGLDAAPGLQGLVSALADLVDVTQGHIKQGAAAAGLPVPLPLPSVTLPVPLPTDVPTTTPPTEPTITPTVDPPTTSPNPIDDVVTTVKHLLPTPVPTLVPLVPHVVTAVAGAATGTDTLTELLGLPDQRHLKPAHGLLDGLLAIATGDDGLGLRHLKR